MNEAKSLREEDVIFYTDKFKNFGRTWRIKSEEIIFGKKEWI